MKFVPITTQEQLDSIITERLKRDREARAKEFEGWVSPEDHQAALDTLTHELEKQKTANETLAAANKQYETASVKSRIAGEVGLDRRLIGRLTGETEDEIRKDAEGLKNLIESANVPPVDMMRSTEPQGMGADLSRAFAPGVRHIPKSEHPYYTD